MFEWWCVIPFAALLICIAVFPLVSGLKKLWHHNWFQLLVALGFGLPVGGWMIAYNKSDDVVHALLEYSQFICLLASLYVVSYGVYVAGDIQATPSRNTATLGIGALLASLIGTTGASMLLIRPLLNINQQRQHKRHTVIFFIFIVANCGGLLTPLGDPPLFLGFLRGVPFTWTLNLLPQWLFVSSLLLATYWGLDRRLYAAESAEALCRDAAEVEPISILGKINLLLLAAIVAAVALSPSPWREAIMISSAGVSLGIEKIQGTEHIRWQRNRFTWHPILEVAALFIGIFLTMIPALKYLGQVAPSLPLNAVTLFIFTGSLSSVLDNAPTYVTFFEMAKALGGEPAVAGVRETYLVSISLGAVFCGAMTYIGNGPNFMVKAIADEAGVPMPSFFGYTLKWAVCHLVPILTAMVLLFIADDTTGQIIGAAITLFLLVWNLAGLSLGPKTQPTLRSVKRSED